MAQIISIHSFRGGTGKSNTTANLATLIAADGKRVGVIDTDIQSPGVHVLFGMPGNEVKTTLNDYLWGKCSIQDAAYDVTDKLPGVIKGKLFMIPSSIRTGELSKMLREGYNARVLTQGLRDLIDGLELDVLMIDTHPGLNQETLLSLVISNTLVIIMRPDQQDYEGTGVTVQMAKKLDVPRMMIMVNKVPQAFDEAAVRAQVERAYGCEVAAILPHSDDMMALASSGIFVLAYPDHPLTERYRAIAQRVMLDSPR